MSCDNELRQALRRVEAPPDFAARVLARAAQPQSAPSPLRFGPLAWAAACVLTVVTIGWQHHETQQRRAETAKTQLIQAMRITRASLQHIRARVHHQED